MFKYFGHEKVYILNGGLHEWKAQNQQIETGPKEETAAADSPYKSIKQSKYIAVDAQHVLESIDKQVTIIDARSEAAYSGTNPAQEGSRSGHIPKAINIPFSQLTNPDNFAEFKSIQEIQTVFEKALIDLKGNGKIITSCGGGITATILLFCLYWLNVPCERLALYDGSWSEWGKRSELPIEPSS